MNDRTLRIFDAWWEEGTFVVISPRFRRLHVPVGKLPALQKASVAQRQHFEIDEEGAYVYWPALDVHLGWEQFAQAVDPEARLRARQQGEAFNRRYGAAIRELRKHDGLRQQDVPGLTARQVGRIERGLCRATHSALSKLAKAHRKPLSKYLSALADLLDARHPSNS